MLKNTTDTQAIRLKSVHRAIADLRRGASLLVRSDVESYLIIAAEQVSIDGLKTLAALAESTPALLITPRRAKALGFKPKTTASACSITLSAEIEPQDILGLIGDLPQNHTIIDEKGALAIIGEPEGSLADLILVLMRQARLLPAALISRINTTEPQILHRWSQDNGILTLEADAIDSFEAVGASLLREVARASLPLAQAEHAEIALFRPLDGGEEHFALLLHPNTGHAITTPPMVRIHSQCITGDILGSLKCDCGNQLQAAISQMAQSQGGVLIYLAQEGRDIGLVNKLKAYALQDLGLDTIDANHALGFDSDHRFFLPAAEILRQLGYDTIRLMTNNLDKVDQVAAAGITVAERIPLITPTNPHNEQYIQTKKARSGHLIDP